LSRIENEVRPAGVITVFGPCYWKPKTLHIMGFANGYLLYEDTYFFTIWTEWKTWKYKLKKKLHQYFLKREALLYWTETDDSKNRLAKFIKKPLDHIIVASNNCSNFFRNRECEILAALPAKKAFRLLYISSYYPHKGFELIPPVLQQLKAAGLDVEMVVTINSIDFERLFKGLGNVINLGNVSPKYCPYIYKESDIVFVPTLLETFTAIYPEAMYSQKPIITTDLPFARTICGDAALYFDPVSTKDAVNKILQILNDSELRDKLIENGLERLKMFDLPEERFRKILNILLKNAVG
jgi:glycosyltransferase involved in cell wall biosynthesis